MGELYGEVNKLTMEWNDGLMAVAVRQYVQVSITSQVCSALFSSKDFFLRGESSKIFQGICKSGRCVGVSVPIFIYNI